MDPPRTPAGARSHATAHGLISATVTVLACSVALGACGSARPAPGAAVSARYSRALRFSDCMRAHHVSGFPDPTAGGGIHLTAGSGVDPASPAFQAARAACAKLLPFGGGNQHPSAQQIASARQVSECMRRHGVTGFPDPTLTPPSSPSGYSILEDRGGVILAVPSTIDPGSPGFARAAKACQFS